MPGGEINDITADVLLFFCFLSNSLMIHLINLLSHDRDINCIFCDTENY